MSTPPFCEVIVVSVTVMGAKSRDVKRLREGGTTVRSG
jgi:hypothetical protein